jgi:hypothetical protein
MEGPVRNRKHENKDVFSGVSSNLEDFDSKRKFEKETGKESVTIVATLACVYLAAWLVVHVRISQFPTPADPSKANVWDFVEARARTYLDSITAFGPRVSGSDSSHASADYILSEINKIRSSANGIHSFETDVQIVSGDFVLDWEKHGIGSYPSIYQNQKNIVVRIGPEKLTYSLLVNCHFDTVIDSPGKATCVSNKP